MKVKISNLLASFAVVFLITFSLQAQDEAPMLETQDLTHRDLSIDEDKALNSDPSTHATVVKDTLQSAPKVMPAQLAKQPKPDTHKNSRRDKEEEDALSYNFLYYMFQKFKMSDLIDQ